MKTFRKFAALTMAGVTGLGAMPASAVTILLNDIGGVAGTRAERGFAAAANFWEQALTDDITINLNVGFSPLGPNVLGSTGSTFFSTTTAGIYQQLAATATSSLDASAVSTLSPLSARGGLSVRTPGYVNPVLRTGADVTTSILDNDDSINNTRLRGTSANLKALGFTLPPGIVDGTIRFSTSFAFDFNPVDGITAGTTDFIAVAIHEIGHALGFVSGVDTYDVVGCPNGPSCAAISNTNINNFVIGDVGDLFRYSAPGVLDWTPVTPSYFSIDGGQSEVFGRAGLSTGNFNGNGFQASHFAPPRNAAGQLQCTGFIGILNPYICDSTVGEVSATDLAYFDAIGYTTRLDVLSNSGFRFSTAQAFAAIPEPATWVQMILGFGLLGGVMRRVRGARAGKALTA